jgi:hypothetical protein
MATTTPNYGWTVPTSTDLVKDGATAIETLGDAIDASMNTALGTKKAGMVLLNTTSFSGVSSQSLPAGTFSATYDNYLIKILSTASSGTTTITARLRASGTDATTNYQTGRIYQNSSTVAAQQDPVGTDEWLIGDIVTANPNGNGDIYLFNPFASVFTTGSYIGNFSGGSNNMFQTLQAIRHQTSSSYDSLTIISSSGTITGKIYCYGYNQ